MRSLIVVLGCAALVTSAPALAGFTPRLSTSTQEMSTSFNTSVSFEIDVAHDDDPLYSGDVYVPPGYVLDASNLSIGFVRGAAIARFEAAGATVDTFGSIVVDNPASFTTNPCAPGLHAGVWTIHFDVRGHDLPLQLYVDQIAGADTALGAYRIRFCTPAAGTEVVKLQVNFRGHFIAPMSPGSYTWRLLATPSQGAATVEARSEILLPAQLRLQAAVKNRTLTVRGTLTEFSQPVAGQDVSIRVGPRLHRARTGPRGAYTLAARVRSGVRTVVWATATVRTRDAGPCQLPSSAPAGCVSMTRAYYTIGSPVVRVRAP